ncbi:hypothetical protein V8C43DRAFT_68941 [Trichoderma afarasin]
MALTTLCLFCSPAVFLLLLALVFSCFWLGRTHNRISEDKNPHTNNCQAWDPRDGKKCCRLLKMQSFCMCFCPTLRSAGSFFNREPRWGNWRIWRRPGACRHFCIA